MKDQKLKPWQQHSSSWEVPWEQRAEQKFDPDKVIFKFTVPFNWSISLSGVVALTIFVIAICAIIF